MNKIIVGLLFLFLAVSCAEENEFDVSAFEEGAFARWMEKYHPEVPKLEGTDKGLYVEWIEKNADGLPLRETYWIEMDYTLRDQEGDIFYTRSAREARLLFGAGFDRSMHYIPERVQYYPSAMMYDYPSGQIRLLTQMNEGDSVRLYMAPEWGYYGGYGFMYSAASHYGFAPSAASVPGTTGLILDLRLSRVIKDIALHEREQVTRFAAETLGIADAADSIALGVYYKKSVENPAGDSIKTKSTAQVYYTARFLDGHILYTNVDSVAKANDILPWEGPAEIVLSAFSTDIPTLTHYVPAMKTALLETLEGERARFVFVSDQGFGIEGKKDPNDNHVTVPPHMPLEYEIFVESILTDSASD